MKLLRLLPVLLALSGAAWGQRIDNPPGVPIGGPVSTNTVTATGQSISDTLANAFLNLLTPEWFGAKADCVGPTDDTAALNAYTSFLRGLTGYLQYVSMSLGNGRCYFVAGSVNMTGFNSGLIVNANGSTIVSAATGKNGLDAVATNNLTINDLTLIGGGSGTPLLNGIQIGHPLTAYIGSQTHFHDVTVRGFFSQAPIYNRASETSQYDYVLETNQYNSASAYGDILDGDATFPIVSQFAGTYNSGCSPSTSPACQDQIAQFTPQSFNDFVRVGGSFASYYGPALYLSNMRGPKFVNGYCSGFTQSGSGPCAKIAFNSGDSLNNLDWTTHSDGNITEDFLITGNVATPVITGLRFVDHIDQALTYVFARDTGVTGVTVHDLHFDVPQFTNSVTVFDNAADWTVDGEAYAPSGSYWNLTGLFTGTLNLGGATALHGILNEGIGINIPNRLLEVSGPSTASDQGWRISFNGAATTFFGELVQQFIGGGLGFRYNFNVTDSNGGYAGTAWSVNPHGSTVFGSPGSGYAGNAGEMGMTKMSASGSAPGAGFMKFEAVAGTNSGSCKIIAYAGTSTTPVTIVDNVGGGC